MKIDRLLTIGLGLAMVPLMQDAAPAAEDAPADVLAVHLRLQGHRCDKALSAERDAGRSKPDEVVWIVKCAEGAYRVQLVPHMAARVERID